MVLEHLKEISLAMIAVGVAATIILPDFKSRRRLVTVAAVFLGAIVTLTDYWLIAKTDRGIDDRIACMLYPEGEVCAAAFASQTPTPFDGYTSFWRGEPLYNADWQTVEADTTRQLLGTLQPPHDALLDVENLAIHSARSTRLSFIGNTALYEIELSAAEHEDLVLVLLALPGRTVVLDGSNDPVYKIAASGKLRLNSEQEVEQYIRFFFSYIRGRHGTFDLVEDSSSLNWTATATGPTKLDAMRAVEPLELIEYDPANKTWLFFGYAAFRDVLFSSKFEVSPLGLVVMSEEAIVQEGLPLRQFDFTYHDWGFKVGWIDHEAKEKSETVTPPDEN